MLSSLFIFRACGSGVEWLFWAQHKSEQDDKSTEWGFKLANNLSIGNSLWHVGYADSVPEGTSLMAWSTSCLCMEHLFLRMYTFVFTVTLVIR